MDEPIRIYVGTEEKTEVMCQVLKYSITKRTKRPVQFTDMIGPQWEYPLDGIKVGTGFSLRRWMIPAACQWTGRAIYLDADQQVFGDIAELWDRMWVTPRPPSPGPCVACTYQPDKFNKKPWPQTSVMVIKCDTAKDEWGFHINKVLDHLRENPKAYPNFMHGTWLRHPPEKLPVEWNHLNVHEAGKTKLLHYTKEPDQPCYKPEHPLADLWRAELRDAIVEGAVSKQAFEKGLSQWKVKKDWRSTNGLHPVFKKYLPLFPASGGSS